MEAYARVGGGLNPRSDFPQRFRNRFECKFSAFPINHGLYGCSGCGRCITACPARIDIREILSSI
jgi:ferredoxin